MKFVITAGGTSVYEFASAKIPQLVVVLEKHQRRMAKAVQDNLIGKILIRNNKIVEKDLMKILKNFYNDENKLLKYNNNAKNLLKEVVVTQLLKVYLKYAILKLICFQN